MRGDIWIGDVARVLPLAQDDHEYATVLACLGFEPPTVRAQTTGTMPPLPPVEEPVGPEASAQPASHQETVPAHDTQQPESMPDTTADLPLLAPVRTGSELRVRLEAASLARAGDENLLPNLPYQPLFAPRSSGAIVRAALSLKVSEGPIDVPTLVDSFARGKPVMSLPRTPVPTLRLGVQVLIDRGLSMQPFRRDQDELANRISSIIGHERTEIEYFADSPLRGTGPGPTWTWDVYRPPTSGAKVLLLSDLGLGGNSDDPMRSVRAEWEDFARSVVRAGCRPVAFVPCPSSAWPRWLSALIPLITWDRRVTVARVAAKL